VPDIIYIDANKERQQGTPQDVLAHETSPNSILCGDDWEWQDSKGEYAARPFDSAVAFEDS
jgi:hypothetical protein